MKKHVSAIYRKILSPSMRFELREMAAWLGEKFDLACFWNWEQARLPRRAGCEYDIHYFGRKTHLKLAKILLGLEDVIDAGKSTSIPSGKLEQVTKCICQRDPIPGSAVHASISACNCPAREADRRDNGRIRQRIAP